MSVAPCFRVKLNHGHAASFKKVMKDFDVEMSTCEQNVFEEFLVVSEEPTTTLFDAVDFCPVASWVPLRALLPESTTQTRKDLVGQPMLPTQPVPG